MDFICVMYSLLEVFGFSEYIIELEELHIMKLKIKIVTVVLFMVSISQSVAAEHVASTFSSPFGSGLKKSEGHHEWVEKLGSKTTKAFHSGEDWAGKSGTELRAIADGTVVAKGYSRDSQGHYVRVKYVLPNGTELYSDYYHGQRASDYRVGSRISRGDAVLHLGSTGAVTGPHVHWTMTTDDSISPTENVYLNGFLPNNEKQIKYRPELTPKRGASYVSPELILEDWSDQNEVRITPQWPPTEFKVDTLTIAAMCYIRLDSDDSVYSIEDAIDAGIIRYGILIKRDGRWKKFSDVNRAFVNRGETHGIRALKKCTFVSCEPTYSNQSEYDRSLQDMYVRGSESTRSFKIRYGRSDMRRWDTWTDNYSSHLMTFVDKSNDISGIQQATSKKYPIIRYTRTYIDGVWSGWKKIDFYTPRY